jgi:hypothetical protein
MSDKSKLDWNIQLNFETPKEGSQGTVSRLAPSPATMKSARETLKQKAPRVLEQIDRLWCTRELHHYLEKLLFTEEYAHLGFSLDVVAAIGEHYRDHRRMLIINGLLHRDVWDMQFGDTLAGKAK